MCEILINFDRVFICIKILSISKYKLTNYYKKDHYYLIFKKKNCYRNSIPIEKEINELIINLCLIIKILRIFYEFVLFLKLILFKFEKHNNVLNVPKITLFMKLIRPFLLLISIILFGWLFMSNINLVNVAATLNEAEINSEITKVNGFTNINQLKQFTIEKINYMEAIRERFSENALVRVAVIAVLVLVQIILYTTKGNYSFNSKTIDF